MFELARSLVLLRIRVLEIRRTASHVKPKIQLAKTRPSRRLVRMVDGRDLHTPSDLRGRTRISLYEWGFDVPGAVAARMKGARNRHGCAITVMPGYGQPFLAVVDARRVEVTCR